MNLAAITTGLVTIEVRLLISAAVSSGLHRSGLKGRRRVLADVEEVRTAQVLIALGMVAVETRGLQVDLSLLASGS